jgi:hypothetical protein
MWGQQSLDCELMHGQTLQFVPAFRCQTMTVRQGPSIVATWKSHRSWRWFPCFICSSIPLPRLYRVGSGDERAKWAADASLSLQGHIGRLRRAAAWIASVAGQNSRVGGLDGDMRPLTVAMRR